MKNRKSLFGLVIFCAAITLGTAYAALSAVKLNVVSTVTQSESDSNFKVEFAGSNNNSNDKLTISAASGTTATFTVTDGALSTLGDKAIGTITLKNLSNNGIHAKIANINGQTGTIKVDSYTLADSEISYYYYTSETINTTKNSNAVDQGFFKVTVEDVTETGTGIGAITNFGENETVTYQVTVELIKAPLEKVTGKFNVVFDAEAIKPQ